MFEGSKTQFPIAVWGKIAKIILATCVNPVVFTHQDCANDRFVWKGIQFP